MKEAVRTILTFVLTILVIAGTYVGLDIKYDVKDMESTKTEDTANTTSRDDTVPVKSEDKKDSVADAPGTDVSTKVDDGKADTPNNIDVTTTDVPDVKDVVTENTMKEESKNA